MSACGDYTAVATLQGSVGIYDTHTMRALRYFRETHNTFVTGVEFLALDPLAACEPPNPKPTNIESVDNYLANAPTISPPLFTPLGCKCEAAVLSISADQSIQLHCLPAKHITEWTATGTLVATLLWAILIYFLLTWLRL